MPAKAKPGTALVVDDEPAVRRFVRTILARQGFEVLEADDGQTAYETLHRLSGAIQLVVTDIEMPRMDGVTLGRKVGAEYPKIKVLYISAYVSDPFTRKIAVRSFVPKPFSPDVLIRAVQRLLK